ncbi:chemotaxis protein CheB, partial [Mycobacterium tuberculosis]
NDDGAEGLHRIHLAGGLTAVQEPKEALIPTMPLAAIARHLPDYVLPLRELRNLLLQLEAVHEH